MAIGENRYSWAVFRCSWDARMEPMGKGGRITGDELKKSLPCCGEQGDKEVYN
jgi:hypothetical protein